MRKYTPPKTLTFIITLQNIGTQQIREKLQISQKKSIKKMTRY